MEEEKTDVTEETEEKALVEVEEEDESPTEQVVKTSTGLDENVAALLSYVLGFVTGIVFLLIEKENRFVRFHAWQSIFVFGGLFAINLVLTAIPFIGWLISLLIAPLAVILWIILLIKSYQGKYFKLPVIGKIAENQLKK